MRVAGALATWLLFLAAGPASADGWSTGLGGNSRRSGSVPAHGPAYSTVLWERAYSSGYALQPVTDGDRVFTSECDSNCANDLVSTIALTRVVARNLRTGAILWSVSVPKANSDNGYASVIAAQGDLVFVTRSNNYNALRGPIYALRETDGSLAWTSELSLWIGSVDSPAFTDDGDLIVSSYQEIVRLRASDGKAVWIKPIGTASPECDVAVQGENAYAEIAGEDGSTLAALDPGTGDILYIAPAPGDGQFAASAPVIGLRGIVYMPTSPADDSTPGLLTAYLDTGTSLEMLWQSQLPAGLEEETFAVASDGSIYSYSTDFRIVRLDPDTGDVLEQSEPITWATGLLQNPVHMARDSDGRLFVSTRSAYDSPAGVIAFDRNLRVLWKDLRVRLPWPQGLALAADGTLVVPGVGSPALRAYRPSLPRVPRAAVRTPVPPAPVTGRGGR